MGRDRRAGGKDLWPVLFPQFGPDIGVKRLVEWRDLIPKSVYFPDEGLRRHIITRPPHLTHVSEFYLPGPPISEFYEALEFGPHRARDGMPADPRGSQLVRIATARHDA